jgi:hypothetical protein
VSAIGAAAPCRKRARKRWIDALLGLVYSDWWIGGVWPSADELQKALLPRPGEQLDVLRACAGLPPSYGGLEDDGRIVLTIAGLHRVSAAADALADFMTTVRLAYARYADSHGSTPTITMRDLSERLHLSPHRTDRVARLLDGETDVFARAATGDGAAGAWEVRGTIYDYRDAHTIDQYLAIQRNRNARARAHRGSGAVRRRVRGWFGRERLTVKDYLLITLLGVIVTAVLTLAIAASPLGPATTSTTTVRMRTVPSDPTRARRAGRQRRRLRDTPPTAGAPSTHAETRTR